MSSTKDAFRSESPLPRGIRTPSGRWSARLAGAFVVLFACWLTYVRARPIPRPTFLSDPTHVVLLLGAVAAAVSGGASGVVALFKGDRSIPIYLAVLLGLAVLYWTAMEVKGH